MHGSGHQVIKTSDGGFAIAGDTDSQSLLLKTDSDGITQWTQTYGNEQETAPISLKLIPKETWNGANTMPTQMSLFTPNQ